MATQILHGRLVGIVDGPRFILEVRGEERSFPLAIELTLDWVQKHLNGPVAVLVRDGRVVEVS